MAAAKGAIAAEPVETPWLLVAEAAVYCRCSVWSIQNAVRAGECRSSGGGRRGKPMMFRREWLDEWMEHR